QITLLISDVPSGEEYNVASGPTLPPANDFNAREIMDRYSLRAELPASILSAIENPQPTKIKSDWLREHFVILSNDDALRMAASAAEQLGLVVGVDRDTSAQPIAEGSEQMLNRLDDLRARRNDGVPVCSISGGEFACLVNGDGVGGRNLETALR